MLSETISSMLDNALSDNLSLEKTQTAKLQSIILRDKTKTKSIAS